MRAKCYYKGSVFEASFEQYVVEVEDTTVSQHIDGYRKMIIGPTIYVLHLSKPFRGFGEVKVELLDTGELFYLSHRIPSPGGRWDPYCARYQFQKFPYTQPE